MRVILFCVVVTLTASAYGQTNQHAEVFTGESVATQLAKLAADAKTTGTGGATLGDYTSHAIKLSVRAKSGNAEIHAHFDDVFVVTGGSATLITGGTVLNPKTHSEGETQGSGIENGETRTIAKGDVVHIPAGTPHELVIAPGGKFSTIVVKVKE